MNAPDVSPVIKAEAARGLLERLWEKTALVRLFRYNASMKHGVPIKDREFEFKVPEPPKEVVKEVPVEKEVIKEVPIEKVVEKEVPAPQEPVQDDPWRWTKNALGALAVAGATAAGTAGLMSLAGGGRNEAAESGSVTKYKQSPLQFIEDRGAHLP